MSETVDHSQDEHRGKTYDVFISYKREDFLARDVLIKALEDKGYEVFWDVKLGVDLWRDELRDEVNRSKLVIALWSAASAESKNVLVEAAGAFHQKKLMSAPIEKTPDDKPGVFKVVPEYYGGTNIHPLTDWADEQARVDQLQKILDKVQQITGGPSIPQKPTVTTRAIDVHLGEIPPAPPKLVGRDDEMEMLRQAWHGRQINTVVLHALGGAGKSALLRAFIDERLATNGGDGAARIYGWSAYSQGSGTQKRADADGFISQALKDFGYPGEPPRDSVERARELAKLIQQERVLLLLDGLEPLQDPPGVNKGRLKDKGLKELIQKLSFSNPGLLVITTRQPIVELEKDSAALVTNHPLDRLSPQAGTDLLEELGVTGRQKEFEKAVKSVDGHALSVTLLGTYLTQVHGGDIRKQDLFDFHVRLTPEEQEQAEWDETLIPARRAQKVMLGYIEQFEKLSEGASKGKGTTELVLLHLLGLFDRPADGAAMDVLLSEPIPGLSDELFGESNEIVYRPGKGIIVENRKLTPGVRISRLNEAKYRLRKLRLLASENKDDPKGLDAHPVVRAYFAERLKETAPEAAKIAHDRLYRHYANLGVPETFRNSLGMGVVALSKKLDSETMDIALELTVSGNLSEEQKAILPPELTRADPKALKIFLDAMDQNDLKQAQKTLLPDTLEEMQPLFHAIAHGVSAGHVQEVCDEVFFRRIERGNEQIIKRVLGAFGPELAALAHFFDPPWTTPHPDLTEGDQSWVLGSAAFALTSLGRLAESVEPRRAALKMAVTQESWQDAVTDGCSLSETLLTLGRVNEALPIAQTALAHAKKSGEKPQIEINLTYLANAQLAAGALDEALASFKRAEAMAAERDPEVPELYSIQGYWYGNLLMARGEIDDALRRGQYQLDIATRSLGKGLGLHNIGLAHLLIGRAQHALNQTEAKASLDAAVDGLRKAGVEDLVPLALLARAAWYRDQAAAGDATAIAMAHQDLDEVYEIAGDEMKMYLVDLALELARLALDVPAAFDNHLATARNNTDAAAALIASTGYHRRDGELADLQARLKALPAS